MLENDISTGWICGTPKTLILSHWQTQAAGSIYTNYIRQKNVEIRKTHMKEDRLEVNESVDTGQSSKEKGRAIGLTVPPLWRSPVPLSLVFQCMRIIHWNLREKNSPYLSTSSCASYHWLPFFLHWWCRYKTVSCMFSQGFCNFLEYWLAARILAGSRRIWTMNSEVYQQWFINHWKGNACFT